MGRAVIELARADLEVIALDHAGGAAEAKKLFPDLEVLDDPGAAMKRADVYIDFSSASATRAAALAAAAHRVAAVIGTTALDAEARRVLADLAARAPVCATPNFSLGVNLILQLAERAARSLGADYDLGVVEIHHRAKKDAPSGTALALADALARGGTASAPIGMASLRGGAVVGEHTAHFLGTHERIEITHRAESRCAFAAGALRAARWLIGRPPGNYSMADVLGLAAP